MGHTERSLGGAKLRVPGCDWEPPSSGTNLCAVHAQVVVSVGCWTRRHSEFMQGILHELPLLRRTPRPALCASGRLVCARKNGFVWKRREQMLDVHPWSRHCNFGTRNRCSPCTCNIHLARRIPCNGRQVFADEPGGPRSRRLCGTGRLCRSMSRATTRSWRRHDFEQVRIWDQLLHIHVCSVRANLPKTVLVHVVGYVWLRTDAMGPSAHVVFEKHVEGILLVHHPAQRAHNGALAQHS
mmetsp:Transcript_65390/g.105962  ORF Transcript_65390/g.105962 Transcript_65390/m.105962 type:complete len:240 (-) Transcript_65390:624-1343(-)